MNTGQNWSRPGSQHLVDQMPSLQPITVDQASAMLDFIPGCEDRSTWVTIGMAIKSEFNDAGWDIWHTWSQQAGNYNELACRNSWRGFNTASSGRPVTIGTVIKLAQDGGFKFQPGTAARPDPAAMAMHAKARQKAADEAVAARHDLADAAAAKAMEMLRRGTRPEQTTHINPYLKRKGITNPEGCRFAAAADGGGLLVPMFRYDLTRDHSLKGLQTIFDSGSKKYSYGMDKYGTACRLGTPGNVLDPVFVCEGYATGLTIRQATDFVYSVWVAFDAGNLPAAVQILHEENPETPIIICADDDHMTMVHGRQRNTGRIQAQIAMDQILDSYDFPAVVRIFPLFKQATGRGAHHTDFNDLAQLECIGHVTRQLAEAVEEVIELIPIKSFYGKACQA